VNAEIVLVRTQIRWLPEADEPSPPAEHVDWSAVSC
jgi:hypothetical protein